MISVLMEFIATSIIRVIMVVIVGVVIRLLQTGTIAVLSYTKLPWVITMAAAEKAIMVWIWVWIYMLISRERAHTTAAEQREQSIVYHIS